MYWNVDIALDSFPYAGTTTTTECLLMAVPVVTLRGHNHAHNVGVSLLSRVPELQEGIASSKDDYVDIAARFANDITRLSALHESLRERFLASSLCNGPEFSKRIEGIFRKLYSDYLDEQQGHD